MSHVMTSRAAFRFFRGVCTALPFHPGRHAGRVSIVVYRSRFYSGARPFGSGFRHAGQIDADARITRGLHFAAEMPTVAGISTKATDASDKMYIVFTCCNCETRAVKGFAKSSYESGVVLVQCPGCKKRHVIADHLGWFGPEKNVEEILAGKGETAKRVVDVDIEDLTIEDVMGRGTSDGGKDK